MSMFRISLCLSIAIAACGPSNRGGNPGGPGDSGGGEVSVGDDGGGPGSQCMSTTCSADLHDVTDCDGNVIQSCGGDLGCANGACVDACASAAANTSSVGCDYYAVDPDSYTTTNGSCFAAIIRRTISAT